MEPSSGAGSSGNTNSRMPFPGDDNILSVTLRERNFSEYIFRELNGRFLSYYARSLAPDSSRQEEYQQLQSELDGSSKGSYKFLPEVTAWSMVSNGKTAADLMDQEGEGKFEQAFVVDEEELQNAIDSLRASTRSYLEEEGRVMVPSELIINYKSIVNDEDLEATQDRTQAAVDYAIQRTRGQVSEED
ncbi:hypothetical protein IAR50_006151 [Cryptococcus sp. DSM 104548]